jgi:hypothetical protein
MEVVSMEDIIVESTAVSPQARRVRVVGFTAGEPPSVTRARCRVRDSGRVMANRVDIAK